MSGLLPVAFWGLEVPPGDVIVPATPEYPATFRITMAAIDPSHVPSTIADAETPGPERATLKIIRSTHDPEDDSEGESDDGDYLKALLAGSDGDDGSQDDNDDTDNDDETNGGPSDPERTKKARKQQAFEEIKKMLALDEDEEMDDQPNGTLDKGKGKAMGDESESDEDNDDLEVETFVVCTLDPTKTYQQPLDITIGENEQVFFKVTGTHAVYLTGNYVIPADEHSHGNQYDSDEDSDGYDLSPDEEDLEYDSQSDELDGLEDPRITEIGTDDEEEAPRLVQTKKDKALKGKNKRAAEDSDDEPRNLDEIMANSLKTGETKANGDQILRKKEQKKSKKLKNNAGEAIEKKVDAKDQKNEASKADKKVKFAKDLEQGPTKGVKAEVNAKDIKPEAGQKQEKSNAGLGMKTVQGVKIDDKVLGKGPAAKKGSKVSMRYIGKLVDGKVFDANKKGTPFSFKLGAGEVIKGWDIGVAGITAGGQRRLTIPAHLAYGSKGAPGIPSNATLIFDIKCLEVK